MIKPNVARYHAAIGRRPELAILLAFALIALILLLVFKLGSEIAEGDTRSIDTAFLIELRHATDGSASWQAALRTTMLDLTALGGNATLVIVVGSVAGFLILAHHRALAISLLLATVGGGVLTGVLKAIFNRPRPEVVAHWTTFGSGSFPSGHAMNSAVVYLTMASLVAGAVPIARVRWYTLSCAITLTCAIGISRLYLGVHWPTDVLAGWAIGAGWALFCWSVALWFRTAPADSSNRRSTRDQ